MIELRMLRLALRRRTRPKTLRSEASSVLMSTTPSSSTPRATRIGEICPTTREQPCWVHKTANVLAKLPKSQQPKAKRALQEIWMAATKADAEAALGLRLGPARDMNKAFGYEAGYFTAPRPPLGAKEAATSLVDTYPS